MLALFFCEEFLSHVPFWLLFFFFFFFFFNLGSFSYTTHAGFMFIWGVSLKHSMLPSFSSGEFLLHIPCWLHFCLGSFFYASNAGFTFIWGETPTSYTSRAGSFLSGKFVLHIPCWLYCFLGSFSYTSHAGFIFYLVSFSNTFFFFFFFFSPKPGEFLLHIPCWLYFYLGFHFYVGSFSYTSCAGFILIWGVFLSQPVVDYFFILIL